MANRTTPAASFADGYANLSNALLIAERPGADPGEALALSGYRAAGHADFAGAAALLGEHLGFDLILIEAADAPEALLDTVLARADGIARERGAAVVAAIREDQIDVAAAHLTGRDCQLLCAPTLAERVAALAIARRRLPAGTVHEGPGDAESVRLQRLNEEVARIADTLARLTRNEGGELRGGVRDPGDGGYRGPPDAGGGPETTAQEIRAAIRSRRLRAQFFQGELFADPAWDMLLDLFAAELERRRVSVSSLCIAAAVPPTTALRWIGTLHDAGLFERQADPSDRRRAYVGLSAKGLDGMRAYVAAVKRQGLAIA